jgi:uncharacterized membrane protein YsdA (DUF1294 family)
MISAVQSKHSTKRAPVLLQVGFWLCIVIAVAVVMRRLIALLRPSTSPAPQMAQLDRVFASHAALTLSHILPALVFVILAPIVLYGNAERFGRAERLIFPVGAVVGITGYAMSVYSVGGWLERSAVLLFDTLFLFALYKAFRERADPFSKRRWLVRSIVILLGIATTRPVMGVFFATSRITHLEPRQFFGMAFWIGFGINFLVVELWLRSRRRARGREVLT